MGTHFQSNGNCRIRVLQARSLWWALFHSLFRLETAAAQHRLFSYRTSIIHLHHSLKRPVLTILIYRGLSDLRLSDRR